MTFKPDPSIVGASIIRRGVGLWPGQHSRPSSSLLHSVPWCQDRPPPWWWGEARWMVSETTLGPPIDPNAAR